ncbi:GNAT family N-acetyltransferase [Fusibacter ferrireducens]|uniref:GNAT family N-acetyltransferase n=1 Tax=Fusibacter ferrireducens TaxID=2785058 RepID=A0ABS0A1L3_9FIRM|nr:GNAT family N-acetyltransferase [Fusibacter ferrireducens]MBF4696030.1 GNAT family N-acetyltransferase [Fusibacter ferrireducens]
MRSEYIKLAEYLSKEDYSKIIELEKRCIEEGISLKLELDYKKSLSEEAAHKALEKASPEKNTATMETINEFMYFIEDTLVGYIGICGFGGVSSQIEVNGMVHPDYRRRGYFKVLFEYVKAEFHKRQSNAMLLLSDRNSQEGMAFIKSTDAEYKHTEYEMYLDQSVFNAILKEGTFKVIEERGQLSLRKASNLDAREIARQNVIYFKEEFDLQEDESRPLDDADLLMPETEEKHGMFIYMGKTGELLFGKTHLQLSEGIGGIYGLGVLPEYRGKGYGRWLLMKSVMQLLDWNASRVILQVEANNANALRLYESCGFKTTATMDYYKIGQGK